MREIKFRAWDEEEKVMIQWDALRIEKDTDDPKISVVVFDGPEGSYFDDFQLLQYTGLTDKNGVEIYEGDIVKNGRGAVLKVEFVDGAFYAEGTDSLSKQQVFSNLSDFSRWSKVIGNTYENPELLEGAK